MDNDFIRLDRDEIIMHSTYSMITCNLCVHYRLNIFSAAEKMRKDNYREISNEIFRFTVTTLGCI